MTGITADNKGEIVREQYKKRNKQKLAFISYVSAGFSVLCYIPMAGSIMAFQNYHPADGIFGSQWVGFKHFTDFFGNYYFWNITRNTVWINIVGLAFVFPAPILFALLLNEIRCKSMKSLVQTISYMPHFISLVVVCGMVKAFVSDTGFISGIVAKFTGERVNLLSYPENFVTIFTSSGIWQELGWNSIIYLAALSGIDETLYEAATIDGANRFKQTIHVTLPGIMPTIIIMLILNIGTMLSVGYEKIILLYNDLIMDKADVISSFTYRKGIIDMNWSYSTAVGLFSSVVNFALVFGSNYISRSFSETSLW